MAKLKTLAEVLWCFFLSGGYLCQAGIGSAMYVLLPTEALLPPSNGILGTCLVRWPDARHVHRLDQDTSGLVVMALTVEAAREMCRQFRERGARQSTSSPGVEFLAER